MAFKHLNTTVIDNNLKLSNYRVNTVVISTNTTATTGTNYVATTALTLTLPASPVIGDVVGFQNSSSGSCVIARNSQPIMSISEDMTIDVLHVALSLQYTDATRGWVFI